MGYHKDNPLPSQIGHQAKDAGPCPPNIQVLILGYVVEGNSRSRNRHRISEVGPALLQRLIVQFTHRTGAEFVEGLLGLLLIRGD